MPARPAASGSPGPSRPRNASPGTPSLVGQLDQLPAAYVDAQVEADRLLEHRLLSAGLMPAPNDGAGKNLCRVMSLLQFAGCPPAQLDATARQVAATLSARPDTLGQALRAGAGLHADRINLAALLEHIFGPGMSPPMVMLQPGAHGEPLLYDPLAGDDRPAMAPADVPDHTLVILESQLHFRAAVNVSGQPLAAVLTGLTAPVAVVQPVEAHTGGLPARLTDAGLQVAEARVGQVHPDHVLLESMGTWFGLAPEAASGLARQALAARAPGTWGNACDNSHALHQLLHAAFGDLPRPPVLEMTMDAQGAPRVRDLLAPHVELEAASVAHEAVMFLRSAEGGLLPVANTSGQPWSTVLSRLRMAVDRTDLERQSEWLRHTIASVKTIAPLGARASHPERAHVYQLGMQTRLTPAAGGEPDDAPALHRARVLAGLQTEVDRFWAQLERGHAADLKRVAFDGIHEVHRAVASTIESQAPATAELLVRQGRVLHMTLSTPALGEVAVDYDHPWERPHGGDALTRSSLSHVDDQRFFDQLSRHGMDTFSRNDRKEMAALLVEMRRAFPNAGIDDFLRLPLDERYQRQRAARNAGHMSARGFELLIQLGESDSLGLARRYAPQPRDYRPHRDVSSREMLQRPDDLDAFDEFAWQPRLAKDRKPLVSFAGLVGRLREEVPDMSWQEFREMDAKEQDHLLDHLYALDQPAARSRTRWAMRLALNPPSMPAPGYRVEKKLPDPDDLAFHMRFDNWARERGNDRAPRNVASFLAQFRLDHPTAPMEDVLSLTPIETNNLIDRCTGGHDARTRMRRYVDQARKFYAENPPSPDAPGA